MAKGIIASCTVCKRFRTKSIQQITATLPRDRITESPPFEIVRVDFVGTLYVKTKSSGDKAYIALFPCVVTRAVHLELVSDLSTE